MTFQNFCFTVLHRPGALHVNADALSRLPREDDTDTTGARLDRDDAPPSPLPEFILHPAHGEGVRRYRANPLNALEPPSADCLLAAVEPPSSTWAAAECALGFPMDPLCMQDGRPGASALQLAQQEGRIAVNMALRSCCTRILTLVPEAPLARTPGGPTGKYATVSTAIISSTFFPAAAAGGLVLLELFGGIGSGLEMCLRNGCHIKRYLYCDIDPQAREVAAHRLQLLRTAYPQHLPATALAETFDHQQDIRKLTESTLRSMGACNTTSNEQWLVVAGSECQDLSSAGSGQGVYGARSSTFFGLVDVLGLLQYLQPHLPPGYVVENVAAQHNFNHPEVRDRHFSIMCAALGQPVCVDAAQAGARAHRLRNFWTNVADTRHLDLLFQAFPDPGRSLQDPGAVDAHHQVAAAERVEHSPQVRRNVPGLPVRCWPTLMSRGHSYSFRPGRQGAVLNLRTSEPEEPSAREREVALGLPPGDTAAPGLSAKDRCQILGRCMDAQCLQLLLAMAVGLHAAGLSPRLSHTSIRLGTPLADANPYAAWPALSPEDLNTACMIVEVVEEEVAPSAGSSDVWLDPLCLQLIQTGQADVALKTTDFKRMQRRAATYIWKDPVLTRMMGTPPAGKICPPPADREAIIQATHERLGHFGVRRTISMLQTQYWWHGLNKQVEEVLKRCVFCDQANTKGTVRAEEAAPLPINGLFYRWGIDTVGPFRKSARGNEWVVVAVEHLTKHAELVAVPDKTATTTAYVLLGILTRFGAPAEVVTDQGTEYQGQFHELLANCMVDHRMASAQHPQANGAAERVVQVVKQGLRKHIEASGSSVDWDEHLQWITLGYRCSRQASTGYSPYYLMHGVHPLLPTAARQRFRELLQFEGVDPKEVAAMLLERAELMKRNVAMAAANLAIAQHRDTRRYSLTRSGAFQARIWRFEVGDLVYLKRGNRSNTLQMGVRPEIYRVQHVTPDGVATLLGQCGQTITHNVLNLKPCHLTDVDLRVDPRSHLSLDGAPCQLCGTNANEHQLLRCTRCKLSYHTVCLEQPPTPLPEADWTCPTCAAGTVEPAPEPTPTKRLMFPTRAQQAKEECARTLHGLRVNDLFLVDGAQVVCHGTLVYLGPQEGNKHPFRVDYDDGDKHTYSFVQAQRLAERAAGGAMLVCVAENLPDRWPNTLPQGQGAALAALFPGLLAQASWVPGAPTDILLNIQDPEPLVQALTDEVDLSSIFLLVAPGWHRLGAIRDEFALVGVPFLKLPPSDAAAPDYHCLQPGYYKDLRTNHPSLHGVALFLQPWALDVALPLAVAHAQRVVLALTTWRYLASLEGALASYLHDLRVADRVQLVPCPISDPPAVDPPVWLVVFAEPGLKAAMLWETAGA